MARVREGIDAEEPVTVELCNYRKSGTRFWNRLSVTPIYDDCDLVRYLGTQRDVTDRKKRERELERQNDLFSKAEELAAVGAWEHDLGSDNLYWTDQVYEIHGCSDDFEPSIERVAELYHLDDRKKLREAVERATTAGEPYDIADERTLTAPI